MCAMKSVRQTCKKIKEIIVTILFNCVFLNKHMVQSRLSKKYVKCLNIISFKGTLCMHLYMVVVCACVHFVL